jgi:hypothetical protein
MIALAISPCRMSRPAGDVVAATAEAALETSVR